MKGLVLLAVSVVWFSTVRASQTVEPGVVWGVADRGVRLGISSIVPDADRRGIVFEMVFQNAGPEDFVLSLGSMVAGGMWPDAIHLEVAADGMASQKLNFLDRRYAALAARVDPFIVSLRSGSRYVLRTTLSDYWNLAANDAATLGRGSYRVKAVFHGGNAVPNLDSRGLAFFKYWEGILESGWAEFQVKAQE